jgi:hypothetical protein
VLGVQGLAVLAGEHQARVGPRGPPGQPLLKLPDPMGLESDHGKWVQGELAVTAGGLGLGHNDRLLVNDDDHLDNGEPAGHDLQVDRPPGQAEQFASSHAGGCG